MGDRLAFAKAVPFTSIHVVDMGYAMTAESCHQVSGLAGQHDLIIGTLEDRQWIPEFFGVI